MNNPQPDSNQYHLTLRDLLAKLDNLQYLNLDPELQLTELKKGEVLFEEGDEGNSMYIVVAGVLGVRSRQPDGTEVIIDQLAPGAIVGELALLSGQKRSATVFAVNDTGLIRLSRSEFEQLSTDEQNRLVDMGTKVPERWQRLQLTKALGDFFGELDANSLQILQNQLEWQHLSNGDVLIRQGEASDGLYLVVNGRLRVTFISPEGTDEIIGEIGPGESVGEFALLTDDLRSADVHAVRETNVVKMTPPVFDRLARENPELMRKITRIIVERQQRELRQQRPSTPKKLNMALLPASPTIDTKLFAQELVVAMTQFGSALALDSQHFDELYGQTGASHIKPDDPANPALVSFMDELEADHDYLIFVADYEMSLWTQRCIGQADRVLIIADPLGDPAPGAVEQMLAQTEVPVRTELVLWHPAETERPQGTRVWLDTHDVHSHHHIRRSDVAHMERLARRLTGRAIALVLSGGAARGFAHLGVHQAMVELGIPIDYVGASSMGAVMGASIVTIESNAKIMSLSKKFANPEVLFDRTLPLTSIMASEKVTKFTQDAFGNLLIEDQWIPFFCVASNLTTAEQVVFQRGPVWHAVRSSLAIPGVFTPVMDNGDTIVDGGVMDNFPTRLMAGYCESDCIIGVNVSPFKDKKRNYDFDTSISGWRILFSRINPFVKSLRSPSLTGVILRSIEVNSVQRAKEDESYVDLMIYPDVKQFGITEYDQFEAITRIGYEAAMEPLREWKEKDSQDEGSHLLEKS